MSGGLLILFSGGLDSYIAYKHAQHIGLAPKLLTVDLGHPYAWAENRAIEALTQLSDHDYVSDADIRRIEVRGLFGSHVTMPTAQNLWVPNRNLLLAVIASMGLPDTIWCVALKGEMHAEASDKNADFFNLTSRCISSALGQKHLGQAGYVTLDTPFADMSKLDIVRYALDVLKLSPEALRTTWSCLGSPPEIAETLPPRPCGNCMVCARRRGIFAQTGIAREDYEVEPYTSELGAKYLAHLQWSAEFLLTQHRLAQPGDFGGRHYSQVYEPARIEEVFPLWRRRDFTPAGAA